MKKLCVLLVLLGVMSSFTACNMLHGAGQDIEDAGEKVKDVSK
ncbi:MAG TPA: entericidin [Verrucomicrobia bacterium]|nr:entericidin [Verrucomicrobiota bacterium]